MGKKEAMLKTGCSRIFWVLVAFLLCTAPCIAAYVLVDGTNSPYPLVTDVPDYIEVASDGILELMPYGYASLGIYVNVGGTIEIYGSHDWISGDSYVQIAPSANVTLFADSIDSIKWNDGNPPFDDPVNPTKIIGDGSFGKLTWDKGIIYSLNISTLSDIAIVVVGSEDPVQLIQDLVLTVADLNLHQGIDNSLDAKLDAALNALDDLNANNDVAAINTLQAFINAVEAQSGNKISIEDADSLIADAQAIIDLLNT